MSHQPARPAASLELCFVLSLLLVNAAGSSNSVRADSDDPANGAEIYASKCVSCHGENGNGTADFPAPLFGDRPTIELADLIGRTMPEGSPEDCVAEEATAVALWMQQTFYSPEAQARLKPPQIDLSRLTVTQYRNAIADLGVTFRWSQRAGQERGLTGEYFADRRHRRDRQVFRRLDPTVDFDFREFSPDGEKIGEEEFAISWEGSIIPPESGWYEFILRTENGARLYLNDRESPLIDVWVRSGSDTEFRARRFLLSGRLYPVRLQWFKYRESTASVSLCWRPPHGVDQPIPQHALTPQSSPAVLLTETPFPPDDRSDGYERGTSVSPEWDDATTQAAIEVAESVVASLRELSGYRNNDDKTEKIRIFAERFVETAFRRPLTAELTETIVSQNLQAAESPEEAIKKIVVRTLKSPLFLYREISGQDDQFDRASRLSFSLLNSIPDKALIEAARAGNLRTEEQLREQAWRLVRHPVANARLMEFFRSWLLLDRLEEVDKSAEKFPMFTPELVADLRTSLDLQLQQVVESENADFRQLLNSEQVFMNPRLAEFYGQAVHHRQATSFEPVSFEPEFRSGVTTHPLLLSSLAYLDSSSPIHRGVFLSRSILGRGIKPPPIAVAPDAPDLAPHLTTRQRVALQTSPESCANCHNLINNLGFALENFDAAGRYRSEENGNEIESYGHYLQRDGNLTKFNGPRELTGFLVESPETHTSLVRQLFHHLVQQPILAYGADTIRELTAEFQQHQYNLHRLRVEIAVRSALEGWNTPDRKIVAKQASDRQ